MCVTDDPPNLDSKKPQKLCANTKQSNDPICCITASTSCLVIGRASGTMIKYNLPHISLDKKYVIRCRPQVLPCPTYSYPTPSYPPTLLLLFYPPTLLPSYLTLLPS